MVGVGVGRLLTAYCLLLDVEGPLAISAFSSLCHLLLGPQEVTETAERRDRKGALYIEELHGYLAVNQELIAPLEPAVDLSD
jgi:hypothetical protein